MTQSGLCRSRTRLDALEFVCDLRATAWEEKFDELVQYKQSHGDCNVPRRWSENPELANWVSTQRVKKDKLTEDRLARLEGLGFQFSI
ncbi:hypothetical protein C1J03_14195 [Sulfitobacter sp. SK012]|uniref:helicase associated domain-containing protein n=1 Tax=Sulfitobacter sp. SK012 TaxID=1389005 RepID=UPI000E0B68D5|nr:hypothetical protein C1J03_14195 [Sulfitobacter sp. SK012]